MSSLSIPPIATVEKFCSKCATPLPLSKFARGQCQPCMTAYTRAYRKAAPADAAWRVSQKAAHRAYRKTPKGKEAAKRYYKTAKGRSKRLALAKRTAEWVDQFKLSAGCMDCGYRAHVDALEFDHRPGEVKRMIVSQIKHSASRGMLKNEMNKCDVVCANCHRVRTANRRKALAA